MKTSFVAACLSGILFISLFATQLTVAGTMPQDKESATPEVNPVAIDEGVARISPENTSVEFTGTHVGDDPKPRIGGFSAFEGTIKVDEEARTVQSIHVEFDMASIWTEFDNLTAHLKNPDFFEVEEYPTASFTSTGIEPGKEGRITVTGELTMHGTTSELSFEATPEFSDEGLILRAEFTLDRTDFGMDKMTSGVEPVVSIRVVVGQPDSPRESQSGHGGNEESAEEEMESTSLVTIHLPNML